MTSQPSSSDFASSTRFCSKDFAIARSGFIDCFASLEKCICERLAKLGDPADKGSSLAQKLKELAAVKPSPQLSAKSAESLKQTVREIEKILPQRNAIAHGEMSIGQYRETPVAMFQNAFDAAQQLPIFIVVTLDDLMQKQQDLRQLREALNRTQTLP